MGGLQDTLPVLHIGFCGFFGAQTVNGRAVNFNNEDVSAKTRYLT